MIRADAVRRWLVEIPDLYALLPLFVLPGVGSTGEGGSTSSNPSRPPVNLDVIDMLDRRTKRDAEHIRGDFELDRMAGSRREGPVPTLTGWVRVVDEDLTGTDGYVSPWTREFCCAACTMPDAQDIRDTRVVGCCVGGFAPHRWVERTISGECGYLLRHIDWIAEQPWFGEFRTAIEDLRRDIRRVLHDVDPPILKCTREGCGWDVETMDGGAWFRCTGCGMTWTQAEVSRLYDRQQPMPLTQCAEILGRPVKTLHDWRGRGWLKPIGRDHRGSLYAYSDVQDVAISTMHGVKRDTPA